MKININIRSKLFKTSIAAMTVFTLTGIASAQETFEVKITHPQGVSVEASYTTMEKQAQKYCRREARRVTDQGLHRKFRTEYIRNCVDQVIGNVLSKIQDEDLIAYHKVQKAGQTSVADNSVNSANSTN